MNQTASLERMHRQRGCTPAICLREVDAKFPDATAVTVIVRGADGGVRVHFSNITIEELCHMKTCLEMEIHEQIKAVSK